MVRPFAAALLLLAFIGAANAAASPSHGDDVPPPSVVAQIEKLKPQRTGVIDVYAVIVGADGSEDVFKREAATVRETLDARLDTAGRSVTLVNDRTLPKPAATLKSIEYVLERVAAIMDRDEDILFLHIASHGGSNHVLVFSHAGVDLYGLSPDYLKSLLATPSLTKAARLAQQITHKEEKTTKRTHSYPQMQVGVLMERRLKLLETRLAK